MSHAYKIPASPPTVNVHRVGRPDVGETLCVRDVLFELCCCRLAMVRKNRARVTDVVVNIDKSAEAIHQVYGLLHARHTHACPRSAVASTVWWVATDLMAPDT